MKKVYLFITFLTASALSCMAQNPIAKGQSQLNAGVGFSSRGVPVYVGMDYGVHPNITVGGEFSFRSFDDRYKENRYDHTIFGFSGNANYHFNNVLDIPNNWDLYAGLNIGFYHWNSPNDYRGDYNSGLGLGAQLGGRYYFNEKFGLNLEFGGATAFSGGKFGISLRL